MIMDIGKTYKEKILFYLSVYPDGLTSTQLSKMIYSKSNYIQGSISSILNKMKGKEVEVAEDLKGPKGGMVYKLKK